MNRTTLDILQREFRWLPLFVEAWQEGKDRHVIFYGPGGDMIPGCSAGNLYEAVYDENHNEDPAMVEVDIYPVRQMIRYERLNDDDSKD